MSIKKTKNVYVGYIYKITNTINDKLYIGQTRVAINVRWSQHKYDINNGTHKPLYRAMKKYGVDKFQIIEVEKIVTADIKSLVRKLNEREQYYIAKYNTFNPNGYNLTIGGDQPVATIARPVDAYNASGELIYSFDSIVDAVSYLEPDGVMHHGISECCKGKLQSALGYIWRYHEDPFDKYPTTITQRRLDSFSNHTSVDQYALDGIFIASYPTITEALKSIGKKDGGTPITDCCKGTHNKAYGYVWRFHGEPFALYQEHHHDFSEVDVYDLKGNMVGRFPSINSALRELKLSPTHRPSICKCCIGANKTCAGYVWRYKGDSFDKYPVEKKKKECKGINRYDTAGNYIDSLSSANKYSKVLNVLNGYYILLACRNLTTDHTAYGYKWYFANDIAQPDKTKIIA